MPLEPLTMPDGVDESACSWEVLAETRKINKRWKNLIEVVPGDAKRCYEWLCQKPMQRWPGRIFPLKGKKYKGAWEYEFTSGDRVYYVPDSQAKTVVVYYAGSHPKPPSPTPP